MVKTFEFLKAFQDTLVPLSRADVAIFMVGLSETFLKFCKNRLASLVDFQGVITTIPSLVVTKYQ